MADDERSEAGLSLTFERAPAHYRHWKLAFDAPIATLRLDVDPAGGAMGDYELKLNSYDIGVDIESIGIADLGQAKKIRVSADNTTIIEAAGATKDIQGRISQVRDEIKNCTSDYDREKLEERLAKLSGGVAQIQVGASTEVEMKEKKEIGRASCRERV